MSDLGDVAGVTPEYYAYVQRYNRAEYGALAAFVYEIVITLDDEIRYVWKSDWSIPKCLFLSSRYIGLGVVGASLLEVTRINAAQFCSIYTGLEFFFVLFVSFTCDGLLLMRVVALFHQRRRLCRALYAIYAVAYIVEVIIAGLYFYFGIDPSATGELLDCSSPVWSASQNLVSAMATLPLLLFNALLFILTLVHLFPYWRAGGAGSTNLFTLFLRQGTIYFAIVFVALFLETVLSVESLSPSLPPWLVLIPIASNRLFLSLRKEAGARADSDDGGMIRTPSVLVMNVVSGSGSGEVVSILAPVSAVVDVEGAGTRGEAEHGVRGGRREDEAEGSSGGRGQRKEGLA